MAAHHRLNPRAAHRAQWSDGLSGKVIDALQGSAQVTTHKEPIPGMFQVVYHIMDGRSEMFAIDANRAVSEFPNEWSRDPWPLGSDILSRAAPGMAKARAREAE